MKLALYNSPWYKDSEPMKWGVRAGSRWPHMQERPSEGKLPRYVPFPFFLANAAAIAQEAGYEVFLLDAVAEDLALDESLERLKAFQPDIVFSESSTPSLNWDLTVFKKLRALFPDAKLVSGGSQGTSMVPEFMAENKLPDYWLGGEFDFAFLDLVKAIEGEKSFVEVPGLIDGEGISNPPAVIANVKEIPFPLYEQLPVQNYSDPVCGLPAPVAQIWHSRGCPYKCTFCVWPQVVFGNNKYRSRDLEATLDNIELLINEHGCESFYFDDDTTNVGPKRMLALAAGIKERGLDKYPWSMMARADCMTDEVLYALKDAGLYSVKYGVESIAESLVDSCEKGTDLKKLHRSIELTQELGIKLHLTFMFGIIGETEETIQETMDFAMKTAPDSAQFSLCTPFPGTKFYRQCEENGWLTTKDWEHFLGSDEAVVSTPWLSAKTLEAKYREAQQIWREFNLKRLAEKQEQLTTALQTEIANGKSWSFKGDEAFAEVLLNDEDVKLSQVEEEGDVIVIVSRHDEEKIYRRLLRAGSKKTILKLF